MTPRRWACVCDPSGTVTLATLQRFSPEVQPSQEEAQVFWLNASGLNAMYGSLTHWAEQLRSELSGCSVAVGFSRFGSYAAAKSLSHDFICFETHDQEQQYVSRICLRYLAINPKELAILKKLGIDTVGGLEKLPGPSVKQRFEDAVVKLHQRATGYLKEPLESAHIVEPVYERLTIEPPDNNVSRLLFGIKRMLRFLVSQAAHTQTAITQLTLRMHCEAAYRAEFSVKPAEATLDAVQLLQLLHLRLLQVELPERVVELLLGAETIPATQEQLLLFAHKPRRDLAAANRALARVRAQYGENAVLKATLFEAHLPEAQFQWQRLPNLSVAQSGQAHLHQLVRRVYARPILVSRPEMRDAYGPYTVEGGWWKSGTRRDYYFTKDDAESWLWVFFDHKAQRWFMHGRLS